MSNDEKNKLLIRFLKDWFLTDTMDQRAVEIAKTLQDIESMFESDKKFFKGNPNKADGLYFKGELIAVPGDIVTIGGGMLSIESILLSAIASACLSNNPSKHDLLGFRCDNPNEEAVLYFDSQRREEEFDRILSRTFERVGLDVTNMDDHPYWFEAFTLFSRERYERQACLFTGVELISEENVNGIKLILIDNPQSFIGDINDMREVESFVDELKRMAIKYNAIVICTSYYHPERDLFKTLWDELIPRSSTLLMFEFDDRSDIYNAFIGESVGFNSYRFRVDFSNQAFLKATSLRKAMQNSDHIVSLRLLAKRAFSIADSFDRASFNKRIQNLTGLKERQSRVWINDMRNLGYIRKIKSEWYLDDSLREEDGRENED